ncbi:MAG: Ig-like domain-containing protein, partial [Anaerolineae bacterium]
MRRFLVPCILLLTLSLMLAACGAAAQGPMTWLDRPLDGAKLPLAPVTIQAHASDAHGVASFQFFVDDAPLVTASADGGRLGTATVEWNPTEPGTYTIRARGVDSQGNAGSDATSVVTVGEMPQTSPTPSLAPEASPPGP